MNGVIDVMAVIFLAAVTVKLIMVLISPHSWFETAKKIWKYPGLTMLISLALAILTLYYILDSGMTMAQIFAVMLFVTLLGATGVAFYSKELMDLADKMMKNNNLVKKSWLYVLIWIVLIIWGIKDIFFS